MKHPFKKCRYLWLIAWWLSVVHTIIVTCHWGWRLMAPHMVDWIELRVLNVVCWWKQGFGLPYPALGRLPFFLESLWFCLRGYMLFVTLTNSPLLCWSRGFFTFHTTYPEGCCAMGSLLHRKMVMWITCSDAPPDSQAIVYVWHFVSG